MGYRLVLYLFYLPTPVSFLSKLSLKYRDDEYFNSLVGSYCWPWTHTLIDSFDFYSDLILSIFNLREMSSHQYRHLMMINRSSLLPNFHHYYLIVHNIICFNQIALLNRGSNQIFGLQAPMILKIYIDQ